MSTAIRSANPYPGARPLTADDPSLLLGRDDLLHEFDDLLRRYAVVELTGPSGVGKSSFVGAGLCGLLAEYPDALMVRPFSAWSTLPPGATGIAFYAEALSAALEGGRGEGQDQVDALLGDPRVPAPSGDPDGFVAAVNDVLGERLVVVFDQLEELLRDDPRLGREFLANVRDVAAALPDGFTQMVSLREEFGSHLRIIEENLDPALWRVRVIGEVKDEVIPDLVRIPLALHPELGVEAADSLVDAIRGAWRHARPDRGEVSVREVLDERRPGLLHLQALLYSTWAELDPAPGTILKAADVAARSGIAWPTDDSAALALFARTLQRYVDLELERRSAELSAQPGDPGGLRQMALETTRVAALIPEHLSSATYKLVRGTDSLAATVLVQLRDLHRQLDVEQRKAEHERVAQGAERWYPRGMAEGSDTGSQVTALAMALALRCRQLDVGATGSDLARAVVADYPGLLSWGDESMTAGRLLTAPTDARSGPSQALLAACEFVVTYERALRWLESSCIIRMTPTFHGERMISIVHDGFGPSLIDWARDVLEDPQVAIAVPATMTSKQIFFRPDTADESTALGPAELPYTEGLGWISCNVTAYFKGLTLRGCDLRSTLFMRCRFSDVVFEDCLTFGLLFLDCTFEGGFTVRSTGSSSARKDADKLRTITFGAGCQAIDGPIRIEGYGGYGAFFDDLVGPWEVRDSSFAHLVVHGHEGATLEDGRPNPGAGPGRVVDSPGLRHVVISGHHPHPLIVEGTDNEAQDGGRLDVPSFLEVPGVDVTYRRR